MHFATVLSGRGEQTYERLERAAKVEEESDGEGDRALLLCKTTHHHEDQGLIPSRLRTLASPWRWATEPLDATMNLLIRRMDNTTFVVEVRRKASMLDLKEAIQKKFQASGYQVSCFRDQKLLEEHLTLYKLGIGELDELVFVRHVDTRPFKDCQQRSFFTNLRRKRDLKC